LKIDHALFHKATLDKYKKIETIPCILSDNNAIKLELNNKSISRKYANNWVTEEITEEMKKFLVFIENENTEHM
jgi:hypothetical protein